jgi:hypothetical protein
MSKRRALFHCFYVNLTFRYTSHLVFCIPFFLVLQFSCELERRLNMNGGSKLLEFQAISYAIGTPDIKKRQRENGENKWEFFLPLNFLSFRAGGVEEVCAAAGPAATPRLASPHGRVTCASAA